MRNKASKRKILSRILISLGTLLVAFAVLSEVYRPVTVLLGISGNDSEVPDPTPIVLKGGDRESVIIPAAQALGTDLPETGGEASVTVTPSVSPAESAQILPGNEDDTTDDTPPAFVELGILKIPKLNVSQFILEGTQKQLKYGLGHISDSEEIGQAGNCVIVGHRSKAFRYIDELTDGDRIMLNANGITYTYSVYTSFVVLPEETWVLGDVSDEPYALTLVTCTPYLIFNKRLIVRARLKDINGLTPETYYNQS